MFPEARRTAAVAAVFNGAIVLLLPLVAMIVGGKLAPNYTNGSTTVRASNAPGAIMSALPIWSAMLPVLTLLSFIAAWRTFVHAAHGWDQGRIRWRGIGEAAACGFGCVFVILLPATLRRPLEAPPFLFTYGVIGAAVGTAVGVILQTAAWIVLGIRRTRTEG